MSGDHLGKPRGSSAQKFHCGRPEKGVNFEKVCMFLAAASASRLSSGPRPFSFLFRRRNETTIDELLFGHNAIVILSVFQHSPHLDPVLSTHHTALRHPRLPTARSVRQCVDNLACRPARRPHAHLFHQTVRYFLWIVISAECQLF